ncbi:sulfatase-like hydrolase/transferase [Verrucomicrobium spinosum]|uniref:sulfatase-like hydrolase/transferase n=1 Tax=Verrucomicrobium spinosum TaxID=2736 RepID=UPI000AE985B4|nr:sulfatase-like hydrolase/transferase [Verrucomicrobium spinosum]
MKFPAPFMALFVFVSSISAADKSRPNVLFIAVDDLRPEFGAYGSKIVKSPHLDRLAASGVTFQHAYCQQAVCSPSRSSLLTGARPDTTQVYDLVRHFRKSLPDVVTLPQHFKNQGYYVQGMGKLYHSGLDDPASWSVPWTKPQLPHGVYGLPENQNLGKKLTAEARAAGKKPNAARRARPLKAPTARTMPSTMVRWPTWPWPHCVRRRPKISPSGWAWASFVRTSLCRTQKVLGSL